MRMSFAVVLVALLGLPNCSAERFRDPNLIAGRGNADHHHGADDTSSSIMRTRLRQLEDFVEEKLLENNENKQRTWRDLLSLGGNKDKDERHLQLPLPIPLFQGTPSMFFDSENNIITPSWSTQSILKVDPETGKVLDRYPSGDPTGMVVDEIVVGKASSSGTETMFWTDIVGGTVYQRQTGGPTEQLYPLLTFPIVDSIALSDDGSTLFFAQCLNLMGSNGLFRRNVATGETVRLGDHAPICKASGLAYRHGTLYAANILEGRVYRVDWDDDDDNDSAGGSSSSNTTSSTTEEDNSENSTDAIRTTETDVTRAVWWSTTVKFDTKGNLYTTNYFTGDLYKINYHDIQRGDHGAVDLYHNVERIATVPFTVEGLAFDKDDRIFTSSLVLGGIYEVIVEKDDETGRTTGVKTRLVFDNS